MAISRSLPFGDCLRDWRRRRGLSQLGLSLRAGVSSRHISFVESGRARPSREMVLLFCRALQVPFRESNDLLLAAGFAPVYRQSPLLGPQLAAATAAINMILAKQEPHPAVVLDRHWNLLRANQAAQRLFTELLGAEAMQQPANVLRLVFSEQGLKPWLMNWPQVARALLERLQTEVLGGLLDAAGEKLLAELRPQIDGLPELDAADGWPLIPLRFRKGALAVDYFSMVTTLGTPRDIALQELRIECFYPA